ADDPLDQPSGDRHRGWARHSGREPERRGRVRLLGAGRPQAVAEAGGGLPPPPAAGRTPHPTERETDRVTVLVHLTPGGWIQEDVGVVEGPFVPSGFVVPLALTTEQFRLEPLAPQHNDSD